MADGPGQGPKPPSSQEVSCSEVSLKEREGQAAVFWGTSVVNPREACLSRFAGASRQGAEL